MIDPSGPPSRRPGNDLILFALLGLACIGILLFGLRPQGGLGSMVPPAGELARQTTFFESMSGTRLIAVEVAGQPETALAWLHDVDQALAALGLQRQQQQADHPASLANRIHDQLPSLIPVNHWPAIAEDLRPESLAQRLHQLGLWMRRPGNEFAAQAALRDLLGLADIPRRAIETLADPLSAEEHQRQGPWLLHRGGEHALGIWQVPFAPSDSRRSAQLIDRLQQLSIDAEAQGLSPRVIGAYRHFVDNDRAVIRDMFLTIPLSLALIIILLWWFFRSWLVIAALHLPAIAALIAGLAALTLWHRGQVPLMALAFAPAIIGIAVDYGIHAAQAARQGQHRRIRHTLFLGWLTTAAAFMALSASHFPLVRGLGILVAAGLGMALLSTYILLPRLIPAQAASRPSPWRGLRLPLRRLQRHPRLVWALLLGLSLLALPGILRLEFTAELEQLDASSPATKQDLKEFTQRWGRLGGSDFVVIEAPSWSAARQQLKTLAADLPIAQALLILKPDAATKELRHRAWDAFWQRHASTWEEHLATAAAAAGMRSQAFAASRLRYQPETSDSPIDGEIWHDSAIHILLTNYVQPPERHQPKGSSETWRITIPLSLPDQPALNAAIANFESDKEQRYIASRRRMASELVHSLSQDLLALFIAMGLIMTTVICVALRSLRQGGAVAAVPLVAVAWAFGLMGHLGLSLSPMHLLVIGFACGIGIDDGVFYRQRQYRHHHLPPMLLTTLTSCAALAALTAGTHPAIRDVALALLLTIAACLIACVLIIPRILPDGPQQR
ncbi:MAG: hypothetical protein EA402_05345 [Planctomycetota bacterium]|nr:MAG: hypothetical protein EA402_05345 [Planctomycetota bacterium]